MRSLPQKERSPREERKKDTKTENLIQDQQKQKREVVKVVGADMQS